MENGHGVVHDLYGAADAVSHPPWFFTISASLFFVWGWGSKQASGRLGGEQHSGDLLLGTGVSRYQMALKAERSWGGGERGTF